MAITCLPHNLDSQAILDWFIEGVAIPHQAEIFTTQLIPCYFDELLPPLLRPWGHFEPPKGKASFRLSLFSDLPPCPDPSLEPLFALLTQIKEDIAYVHAKMTLRKA